MIRVAMTGAPDASGHYRIRQPAAEVLRQFPDDFHVQIDTLDKIALDSFDLLVLQRPMWWFMPGLMDQVHELGKPIIIELDDDFHHAHPSNRGFSQNHPRRNSAQNWEWLSLCLKRADWVSVSSTQLALRYGSAGRVSVLRNCVDDAWLDIPHHDNGEAFGWAGTTKNHPNDPQATCGAIPHVLAGNPGWRFNVIGANAEREEVAKAFGFNDGDPIPVTDYRPLELHPYVLTSLDVGIVPLAETTFNAAKSWLKGLEYAALGIPFIASDLPEYGRLADEHGIGVTTPNKSKRWRAELNFLLSAPDTRRLYGNAWRDTVRSELTISKNAWRWAEVWREVVEKGVRRGRTTPRAA